MQRASFETIVLDAERSFKPAISRPQLSDLPVELWRPYNGRSNTSTTPELAEFRKITTFKKNTISNEHPVCKTIFFC